MASLEGWHSATELRPLSPQSLNGTASTALRLGATTQIITGAASASVALPTDANGVQYKVVLVTAVAAACWFNFNTAGDAAVATAASTYALSPNAPLLIVLPPGATQASAIQDTAAGHITFVGVY